MSTMLAARPYTHFSSPDDRTATEPPELRGVQRDAVRLMIATPAGIQHTIFFCLAEHLRAGDVLVVNTSATMPGQLDGSRNGVPVIVHIANRLPDGTRVVELRSAPDAATPMLDGRVREQIDLPGDGLIELIAPYPKSGSSPTGFGSRLWRARVSTPGKLSRYLCEQARPIGYGYLSASFPISAYQTIFALHPGSAEMPSAGRPFSAELVTRLVAQGVIFAPVTLHTGLSSQDAGEAPQPEWFEVTEATADVINSSRARGGRVIAVGTTATRAVESAAQPDGTVAAATGWTDLVISPNRPVRVVDGLITGWHNPEASHLLLVESVGGAELTQHAYDAAVAEHYLWHEFGDSCLLLKEP